MEYRREIDGLRSLAVLPVIFFHAGFAWFSGGFIGVDVFFVISGYLITGILIRDLDRGDWSLLDFYERRARRILPALVLVILCCWPFAWAWMLPLEMKDFAQSTAAAALSVSNILFWMESDYFDSAAELKPLLHTWSLGVEEQFYILFPLLLALLWRAGMSVRVVVLLALALASFAACVLLVRTMPAAVFYLLPFRAWELLAGAGCALWHARRPHAPNAGLALIGVVAIAASVVLFDRTTPFPSAYALMPVGGACLVLLFAAPGNLAGRILCLPPLVGIGLISYSAYLWHQPLLAFGRIYSPDHPSAFFMLTLALMSLPLAYLSWRFVETPFRKRGAGALLPGRALVLSLSVAIIGLGALGGAWGHVKDGWPGRYSAEQQAFLDAHAWSERCMRTRVKPLETLPPTGCSFAPEGAEIGKVALIGDSVMSSASPALIDFFTARGYRVEQFTHSHCTLHRRHRYDDIDAAACPDFVSRVADYVADQGFDIVVNSGNFLHIFQEGTGHIRHVDGLEVSHDAMRRDMAETVALMGGRLILILPHPRADVDVRARAVRGMRTHGEIAPHGLDRADHDRAAAPALAALAGSAPDDAIRVDLADAFCGETRCDFIQGGAPVLSDVLHFSRHGADRLLIPALEDALQGAGL